MNNAERKRLLEDPNEEKLQIEGQIGENKADGTSTSNGEGLSKRI